MAAAIVLPIVVIGATGCPGPQALPDLPPPEYEAPRPFPPSAASALAGQPTDDDAPPAAPPPATAMPTETASPGSVPPIAPPPIAPPPPGSSRALEPGKQP